MRSSGAPKMTKLSETDFAAKRPGEGGRPGGSGTAKGWLRGITTTVVVLGAVSLFTDVSSEMIVPLRLIFLVQTLGAPLAVAGLIEGVAEAATTLLKIVSGRLTDRFPRRRGLVIAGYSVSNLSKPLLAFVTTWPIALGLILLDRAGKAVRGAPRDAIIADAVVPEHRGKAFGFHRGADTLGAAAGPLLALVILAWSGGNVREVFIWTLVPGILAIDCAILFLRDARRRQREQGDATGNTVELAHGTTDEPQAMAEGESVRRGLGPRFWLFTAIATVFALGNSSDAFLFLRTEGLESSLLAVPLLYFFFNIVYAVLATPLGGLSDRFGRLPILAVGYAVFTTVYLGWTQARLPWHGWALFALYGVYYAATEGVGKAFISDLVGQERRGTALGWYNALTGVAALPANILGAWLWTQFGAGATFALGAWLGAVAFCLLILWWPWLRAHPRPWTQARGS